MIEIVVTTDKGYVQHLGVMLCSLFENNPQQQFTIYILFDFRKDSNTRKLDKLIRKYGQVSYWHQVSPHWGKELKVNGHVTRSTYYRLLIPEILPATVDKVLYLDSDMVVRSAIKELWETVLGNFALAAVSDINIQKHNHLGIPTGQLYFNAGVLLINLTVWREKKIAEQAMQFATQYPEKIEFWDQDALNAVLTEQWRSLSQQWNQTTHLFNGVDEAQALRLPHGIVHFTGSGKPWHYLNNHPLKQEYYRYLKLTPWKDFRHAEKSAWHLFKQSIKKILNLIRSSGKYPVYH